MKIVDKLTTKHFVLSNGGRTGLKSKPGSPFLFYMALMPFVLEAHLALVISKANPELLPPRTIVSVAATMKWNDPADCDVAANGVNPDGTVDDASVVYYHQKGSVIKAPFMMHSGDEGRNAKAEDGEKDKQEKITVANLKDSPFAAYNFIFFVFEDGKAKQCELDPDLKCTFTVTYDDGTTEDIDVTPLGRIGLGNIALIARIVKIPGVGWAFVKPEQQLYSFKDLLEALKNNYN